LRFPRRGDSHFTCDRLLMFVIMSNKSERTLWIETVEHKAEGILERDCEHLSYVSAENIFLLFILQFIRVIKMSALPGGGFSGRRFWGK
jgi:hypothetical protein